MHRLKVVIVPLAVAALLAACSSSSSKTATTSAGGSTATTAASGASSCSLANPIKLTFLWEIKGESSVAIDDFQNGAQLAIDQINAAGGACGHPVQATRISASATDPAKATQAYLQAVDQKPDGIIGYPSGIIDAVTPTIDKNGIPTIAATADQNIVFGGKAGTQWLWLIKPFQPASAQTAVDYFVQDLGKKKIGILGDTETYGTNSDATSKAELTKLGLQPFATATFSPTATDLTQQVLAMKGADAVINWAFPNTVAVQLNQFQQNGLDIPTLSGGSASIVVNAGLAKGAAIANLYEANPCNPAGSQRAQLQKFTSDYEAKYGSTAKPNAEAALTFDAVNFMVKAIEKANSVDPAKVQQALNTLKMTDGACASDYHSDDAHLLHHEQVIVKFNADGTSQTLKTYTIPDKGKGGV